MQRVLITGGAGFIGCNAAKWHGKNGYTVTLFDNLSRPGAEKNLAWLESQIPKLEFVKGDIRDRTALERLLSKNSYDRILHCAGQVAVTTSVTNPVEDFEINAGGTVNLLEAVRKGANSKASIIYTSTNKVYGELEDILVQEDTTHYSFTELKDGVNEERSLDFHSPYGCSKGSADQYMRDYARIYDMNTIVFRQSCIYGERQMGMEDQGWVAWFALRAVQGKSVHVYGDGKQVRDALCVLDLVKAYDMAFKRVEKTRGQIFNIGGGSKYALSVVELLVMLKDKFSKFSWDYNEWRPGDQKIFISNIIKAKNVFGWEPKISPKEGVTELVSWISKNQELFVGL